MQRSLAAVLSLPLAVMMLTACGQQIAGTSATASNSRAAEVPSVRPTVTATAAETRTVTASSTPPVTVTATQARPETITQTPPPVVVVPAPRVTVTQAPSTVYVPGGSSAADQQVAADWLTAESVTDVWIPQLSSNSDSPTAMAKYNALSARYSGVFMVASGDFTSFRNPGYYVTMIAIPFGSPAEANHWCDAQGFAADDCLAKRLSHTAGPDGSSVER